MYCLTNSSVCFLACDEGAYFSAVDLASIAQSLDEDERQRMAEGDVNSPEYLNFIQVCMCKVTILGNQSGT